MARISLFTEDGVTIIGSFRDVPDKKGCALLLHAMPANKESWAELQEKLTALGYASLAIDFRGHGESMTSASGGALVYQEFNDGQHQRKILDVKASVLWLKARGCDVSRLALVGASIGANLAIRYASENPGLPAVVALSPGL